MHQLQERISLLQRNIDQLKPKLSELSLLLSIKENQEKLAAFEAKLLEEENWQNSDLMRTLGQEKAHLVAMISPFENLESELSELSEWLLVMKDDADEGVVLDWEAQILDMQTRFEKLSFSRMFSGEADAKDAYLSVQSGSGGTEAQDWAAMLLRMYQGFLDSMGFAYEVDEESFGEVAGIKSTTLHVRAPFAYGYLRTETGVHRLVRKSPFDSGNRRHTSFASVFVSPVVDENIEIEINPSDLRIDTYRASGAGGQHVNKTDSAVRITHVPSNIVVQSQAGRSQHHNKDQAMRQLKSRLYEQALQEKQRKAQELEAGKSDISWGHQIRSYVLDQARIKDLRTGHESSNTRAVLDGDLLPFIEATLKHMNP